MSICGIYTALMMSLFILWESFFGETFTFLSIGGASFVTVSINSFCLLEISGSKAGSWMPFAQGMFGVGALLAPLVVKFMAISSYYAFAISSLLMSLLHFCLPAPEHSEHGKDNKGKSVEKKKDASGRLVILIGVALFVEVGVEITAAGWFPSYAVLTDTFEP